MIRKKSLWNRYFKIGKRTFRKTNYKFNGSILTDAFTACICFELKDDKNETKGRKNGILESYDSTQYVTDLSDEDKDAYNQKYLLESIQVGPT